MIDIKKWMPIYKNLILNLFGERVLFIGLQGSYARGESNEKSDIDVVLILYSVSIEDLFLYKNAIKSLPNSELICGFVSGKSEISNWCRYDLFQFYMDTIPVYGELSVAPVNKSDAKEAALAGACSIYHACSHNYIHAEDFSVLNSLYKSAFFVLQAKHYFKTGEYIKSRSRMKQCTHGLDLEVLENMNSGDFSKQSAILLKWSSDIINNYQ